MSGKSKSGVPNFNWSFGYRKSLSVLDFVRRAHFKNKKKKVDDFWGVHLRRCQSMHLQRCHSIPTKVDHCLNPNVKIDNVSNDKFYSLDNVSLINDDLPNCAINDSVVIVDDYQTVKNHCNDETRDDEDYDTEQLINKLTDKADQNIFCEKNVKKDRKNVLIKDPLQSRPVKTKTSISNTNSLGSVIKRASQLIASDKKDFPSKVFHQIFNKRFSARSVGDAADLNEKIKISSNTYHFCQK